MYIYIYIYIYIYVISHSYKTCKTYIHMIVLVLIPT